MILTKKLQNQNKLGMSKRVLIHHHSSRGCKTVRSQWCTVVIEHREPKEFNLAQKKIWRHYILVVQTTVRNNWVWTMPFLYRKFSIFKMSRRMLNVKPQLNPLYSSLQYPRASKWGTVRSFISRGIRIDRNQIQKFQKGYILYWESQKFDFWHFWWNS